MGLVPTGEDAFGYQLVGGLHGMLRRRSGFSVRTRCRVIGGAQLRHPCKMSMHKRFMSRARSALSASV